MTAQDTLGGAGRVHTPGRVRDRDEAQRGTPAWLLVASYYVRALKPRETLLLTLMGLTTAVVGSGGTLDASRLLVVTLVVAMGSGGTNGLTNYLDRDVDARMRRTQRRVLPLGRLSPRQVLVWSAGLVAAALAVAWAMEPMAALLGAVCVATSVAFRKTGATHFLGAVSSCGPVLVAWFAAGGGATPMLLLLCAVVMVWEPVHVWNIMIAYRDDYLRAGVNIFPVDHGEAFTQGLSLCATGAMTAAVIALWWVGDLSPLFLGLAGGAACVMLGAAWRAARRPSGARARQVFRLSAYPFLGALFIGMTVDVWVRAWAG